MRKFEYELRRQFPFAEIEVTGGNHLRLRLPNGRSVFVASTPGDRNVLRNAKADVRRLMQLKNEGANQ